jgi:hypothetical protein
MGKASVVCPGKSSSPQTDNAVLQHEAIDSLNE